MTGKVKRRHAASSVTSDVDKSAERAPLVCKAPSTDTVRPRKSLFTASTINRLIVRLAFLFGALLVYFFTRKSEISLVKFDEVIGKRSQPVDCSSKYTQEVSQYAGCSPSTCGRIISDRIVLDSEAEALRAIAVRAFKLTGGSSGSASILDLHSGALSKGDKFVNVYKLPNSASILSSSDLQLYKTVKQRMLLFLVEHFGVSEWALHLTQPTFFSRLTDRAPLTVHDEYWHVHVDKETYPSFHYTSLLYLNDFGVDFTGGRFVFTDSDTNRTVEPRKGRVSAFTSGWENPHQVERVSSGVRYALTVSFTCDSSQAIADPSTEQKSG